MADRQKVLAGRVPESVHKQAPNMHRFVSQRHLFRGEKSFKSHVRCAKITISTLPPVIQKATPKKAPTGGENDAPDILLGAPGPTLEATRAACDTLWAASEAPQKDTIFCGFQNASKTASEPTKGEKRSKRARGAEPIPPHTPLYKGTR